MYSTGKLGHRSSLQVKGQHLLMRDVDFGSPQVPANLQLLLEHDNRYRIR